MLERFKGKGWKEVLLVGSAGSTEQRLFKEKKSGDQLLFRKSKESETLLFEITDAETGSPYLSLYTSDNLRLTLEQNELPKFKLDKKVARSFESKEIARPSKWVNLFTRLGHLKGHIPHPYPKRPIG